MKNLFKKSLSLFLAAMMLFSVGMAASAVIDFYDWELDDNGHLTVYSEMPDFSRPAEIPWRRQAKNIVSITLDESITRIPDRAFSGCSNLESIELNEKTERIGSRAFQGCGKLKNIEIPMGLNSIGEFAFGGCASLTSIEIPANVTYIGENAFNSCSGLERVEIYSNKTSVYEQAFFRCENLAEIKLPSGIYIRTTAFDACYNITTVDFTGTEEEWKAMSVVSSKLNSLSYAKVNYNSPVSLYVTGISVTSQPEKKLYMYGEEFDPTGFELTATWSDGTSSVVTDLSEVDFEESEYWDSFTVEFAGCTAKIYVTFKAESDLYVSGNCGKNLTWELGVREGVLTISGTGAMYRYNGTSHKAPWDYYSYNNDFHYSDYIKTVKLPEGLTCIGNYAFMSCSNLTNVELPESLESIGDYAFSYCKSLETIDFSDGVIKIGRGAFQDCINLKNAYLPDKLKVIPDWCFSGCKKLENVEINLQVTHINYGAFYGCEALENIEIPESVTTIESFGFYGCTSMKSIKIPASVISFDGSAFENSTELSRIEVDEANPKYLSDENGIVFNKDKTELHIYPLGKKDTEYVIPEGVTSVNFQAFDNNSTLECVKFPKGISQIDNGVFWSCTNIKSVYIPNSVKNIETSAFGSKIPLESVYYSGTQEEWNQIQISHDNAALNNATVYFHDHSYTSAVTKDTSCAETGVMAYICECGKSYTEEIAVLEHKAGEWESDETGKQIRKCIVCSAVVEEKSVTVEIPRPSQSEVSYGDSIVLDAGVVGELPEGAYIVWTSSNGNFDMTVSEDGKSCTVTSVEDGETTFTATVYDAEGNVIETTSQTVTSNAGVTERMADFFEKIFGFFFKLFR